jgi:hypothetical protein
MSLSIPGTPESHLSACSDHTKGDGPDRLPTADLPAIPFTGYINEGEQGLAVLDDDDSILHQLESFIEYSPHSPEIDIENTNEDRAPSPGQFAGIEFVPNAGPLRLRRVVTRKLDDLHESSIEASDASASAIKPSQKKQRVGSKSSKKSQKQPLQTTERETPCLGCVKNAISGRSLGECYNTSSGAHCHKCNPTSKCEPIPDHAVCIAREYLRLKRLDSHQAMVCGMITVWS